MADKDHPYSEPDAIYHALLNVLKSRSEHFQEACTLFEAIGDRDLLETVFQEVALEVQRIFEVFGYADRVDSPRIPFEILRCLSWAAKDLLGEECKAVVRLDTAYNYTIVSCRRKFDELYWEQFWSEATLATGRPAARPYTVLVLGFPSPDAGATLLHALAAHEFGHEIIEQYHPQIEKLWDTLLIEAKSRFQDIIHEYILDNTHRREGVPPNDAIEESAMQFEAKLIASSYRWISEVWADLVAARLVGPASLAAFDRIVLNNGAACDSHPSATLRKRLVENYLKMKMPEVAKDEVWASVFLSPATSIPEGEAPFHTQVLKPVYPMLEYVCERSLNELAGLLDKISSPLTDPDSTNLLKNIETFVTNLAPPNAAFEKGKMSASAFWLLMYGVWHFRLSTDKFNRFCRDHGFEDHYKGESVLGNLLLHALQAAELEYQWNVACANKRVQPLGAESGT
ncbi:MAG: hypothetical protein ACLQG3_09570 [Terracidiphilus sp.]